MFFFSIVIYLEVWRGQIRSGKEQLVDPCSIWRGKEDLSRGGALMIRQNELLALCAMVQCCHNLNFLLALLLRDNLTQPRHINNRFNSNNLTQPRH